MLNKMSGHNTGREHRNHDATRGKGNLCGVKLSMTTLRAIRISLFVAHPRYQLALQKIVLRESTEKTKEDQSERRPSLPPPWKSFSISHSVNKIHGDDRRSLRVRDISENWQVLPLVSESTDLLLHPPNSNGLDAFFFSRLLWGLQWRYCTQDLLKNLSERSEMPPLSDTSSGH